MDCDFFKDSYYITQPRSQGESMNSEDLSWLIHPLTNGRDPKEQVAITTDVVTETDAPPSPHSSPVPEHLAENEVTPESPTNDTNNNMPSEDANIPKRYELPPRSTRGVPPKRYDPEFESQRSRYPIEPTDRESLSHSTVAFNTSLYSNTLPRTTEEAHRDLKWKKAMEEEIMALKKNETWE